MHGSIVAMVCGKLHPFRGGNDSLDYGLDRFVWWCVGLGLAVEGMAGREVREGWVGAWYDLVGVAGAVVHCTR